MSEKPGWLDLRMSIGNIVTIITVLIGIVAGWYGFDTRLKIMEVERERMELRIAKMENERDATRDRLISIEVTIREQRSTLDRILKAVERAP